MAAAQVNNFFKENGRESVHKKKPKKRNKTKKPKKNTAKKQKITLKNIINPPYGNVVK
jgi:hypothetical protein